MSVTLSWRLGDGHVTVRIDEESSEIPHFPSEQLCVMLSATSHAMRPRCSLVIFDCDGVLVDSEPLEGLVMVNALRELGLTLSLDEWMVAYKGWKLADCLAHLGTRLGRPLPGDFAANYRARSAEVFRRELQAMPGVLSALAHIPVPVCVASNGPREKIILNLTITGLLRYFDQRVFSAYEIDSWKPDPGLFLHAATSCGVPPAECVVVEDSETGIRAGIAAGMRVLAYGTLAEGKEFEALGATLFTDMAALPSLLGHAPYPVISNQSGKSNQ